VAWVGRGEFETAVVVAVEDDDVDDAGNAKEESGNDNDECMGEYVVFDLCSLVYSSSFVTCDGIVVVAAVVCEDGIDDPLLLW
jgi:hypothetical protein